MLSSFVTYLIFTFGQNNVGFVILLHIFFLIEMFAAMAVSGLDDSAGFGWREFIRFWLMKMMLLMVPLLGAGVDWAWYLMSGPDLFLGQDVHRYTTKAMLIGVLGYQFREVGRNVLLIYKDLAFLKMLMHQIDKMMNAGQEPPFYRRKFDPPYDGEKNAERRDAQELGRGGNPVRNGDDSL